MVPAQQHFGNRCGANAFRARIVRVFEQTIKMGFAQNGVLIVEDAGQQAAKRLHHHHRRQFPAAQHIVADGQLLVHRQVDDALIDPLVAPRQEHQAGQFRKALHLGLVQAAPLRRKIDHQGRGRRRRPRRGNRLQQRLRQHDHAGAAAVGPVIHRAPSVRCMIARVEDFKGQVAALDGAAQHAGRGYGGQQFGKDGDDADPHLQSNPSQCTWMQPSRRRTSATCARTKGISVSASPPITRTS